MKRRHFIAVLGLLLVFASTALAANKTWVGATTAYSTAGNWSPSGVPIAGDHVRIPAGSGSIATGLDQSAVAVGDFIVEPGYTGTIGSSAGYLQIDPDRFEFSGTGVAYIDIGAAAISPQVFSTATAAAGLRGLYLKGSAIATLNVTAGKVGLAVKSGETSTATTIRSVGSGASVWAGAGVTLTTYHQTAGDGELRCACTTINLYGGTLATKEIGAITTINSYGGTLRSESVGTATTINANGGRIDFTGSGAARTVTTLKQNPGSTVVYDPAVMTFTNRSAPDYPIALTAAAP